MQLAVSVQMFSLPKTVKRLRIARYKPETYCWNVLEPISLSAVLSAKSASKSIISLIGKTYLVRFCPTLVSWLGLLPFVSAQWH